MPTIPYVFKCYYKNIEVLQNEEKEMKKRAMNNSTNITKC